MQGYMKTSKVTRKKRATAVAIAIAIVLSVGFFHQQVRADEVLTLERFVNLAVRENLEGKVAEATVASAKASDGSILLTGPMVGLTQMTAADETTLGFEVSQTLPFPSKILSVRETRRLEAETQVAVSRRSKREITARALFLYFQLWQRQERVSLLREKKRAIEQHIKLATAGARSDSFQKIHVIKTESELDWLENEILQAYQEVHETQIEAARFINSDPRSFKPIVNETMITVLPRENDLATSFQLEVRELELATLRAREREAEAKWFPDLNLRYRDTGNTRMSPRTTEIMLAISLPYAYFWAPRAISERASADRYLGELRLQQEKSRITAEQVTLFSRAHSLQRQLVQIREKLLPRAEKRMRFVHNLAPRDMEILQDHRETMELVPDLKLKALEIRGQYEAVVTELKKFESGSEK
jgi:outer membrane protein TolC